MKKSVYNTLKVFTICSVAAFCLHSMGGSSLASEGAGDWRSTYDTVLRWINFIVLVFVAVKFGKDPIKKFFASQKAEVVDQVEGIEAEKRKADEKIAAMNQTLADNHLRLDRIKEQIIGQGERKKEQIIADAERQSSLMLEAVEQKVARMIAEAENSIRSELIDASVGLVEKRLPELLTKEDDQKYVDQFLSSLKSK
jgi:F-type H+-transporting ATPase subunit b